MKSLTVFIPALNEEKHIGNVIKEIPVREIRKKGFKVEILVVNGPSTDRTEEIARKNGATVIPTQKGKGNSVRDAFKYIQSDYTIMLDADETYPAKYILQILDELDAGSDVVMGSRLIGKIEQGAMSKLNYVGNLLLTSLANFLFGTYITDLCTGYWGFRKKVIKSIYLYAKGFDIEANIFSEVTKRNFRFSEIGISYRQRRDKAKLKWFRDGLAIGWRLFDLKWLGNKKLLGDSALAVLSLVLFNVFFHSLFFAVENNLQRSFELFGVELMPILLSTAFIVVTFAFMMYATRGSIAASAMAGFALILSTDFLFSLVFVEREVLLSLLLFIVTTFGILLTFGKENVHRHIFTLIPFAALFFFNQSMFLILLFVYLAYFISEYRSIASKQIVWLWIIGSFLLLLLTTNLFTGRVALVHLLYYISVSHFAVSIFGLYHSAFHKREKILVVLFTLLIFLAYNVFSVQSFLNISSKIIIFMLVYSTILLTGIGAERIIYYLFFSKKPVKEISTSLGIYSK
ncbi:MAG: glycosyltransferase [Candidatus Diapherotrites archaeon]|uniref:Glycosyltransferase n=1 Tax=Candidatus Iainarchaeum sp. TaxID=3101447 RepID=A0A7J4ITF2_9ARCH|nr:MAG: glycosyltransferase [archaeon GW2011_AR10]MBS3059731.1 glycosyltransferase [Candidatus Diapherotrites archaeon]HIH08034.1 glycosyltransferase [Candidatus Diapherotrites archaeon]